MAGPSTAPDNAALRRYLRQIQLPEIGVPGQAALAAARVLVVGAGGLGSPVAMYLAAAGIGALGLADFDQVEESNLPRQLLHPAANVGRSKLDSAAATLRALNPAVRLQLYPAGVTPANALALCETYDLIVDGTDNFAARYLINDAAVLARRPLIQGSIYKFEGQVTVFDPARGGPCYRCLFPAPPASGSVPGCGEAGVVGPLCGVIGSLMAMEVIKLVAGCGAPLRGRLLTCDLLQNHLRTLEAGRDPACPVCGRQPSIRSIEASRYPALAAGAPEPEAAAPCPLEITAQAAHALLATGPEPPLLIDVRESFECGICRIEGSRHIPMHEVAAQIDTLPRDRHLLVLCHHGQRSRRITVWLRRQGFSRVSNVTGGIHEWALKVDPLLARY